MFTAFRETTRFNKHIKKVECDLGVVQMNETAERIGGHDTRNECELRVEEVKLYLYLQFRSVRKFKVFTGYDMSGGAYGT